MLEKCSEHKGRAVSVTAVEDIRQTIDALAGAAALRGNCKAKLAAAARRAGTSYRTMKSLFYGEPVHPAVLDRVRAAGKAARDEALLREGRNEYEELRARIARLEALLVETADPSCAGDHALGERAGADHRPVD